MYSPVTGSSALGVAAAVLTAATDSSLPVSTDTVLSLVVSGVAASDDLPPQAHSVRASVIAKSADSIFLVLYILLSCLRS